MAYYLYRWSVYGEKLVVTLTLKDTAGSILAVRKTLSTLAGSQGLGIGLSWTGFILMKTRQEKDIKFNPVSLYVPASRCLWLGNIQLESKTHSSTKASMKMQAFPWYSLGNSLLHLFWSYVEHSHRSVYPLPWWLLGGKGLFTLPVAGLSIVSQGCLVPLFLGPSNCSCLNTLKPIPSEKLVRENSIFVSLIM